MLKRRRDGEKRIARERISILFDMAMKAFHEDRELSRRYVELARKIGMKCNLSLPWELKRSFCKGCGSLLVPGVNVRIRIRSDGGTRKVITCLECGESRRYPVYREKLKN